MPIARIRTSDPEAISFLAAKLADSGFQVQFAVPGESLPDDVDLDITVTHSKKSPKVVGAWTTAYHVEPPEISDYSEPGDECRDLDIPWNERELARILATGSKGVGVRSLEVEQQPTQESVSAEVGGSAVLQIVEDTRPARVSQPVVEPAKTKPVVHMFTRAETLSRHSLRQRFASIAAILTLTVTAVFSLALSGGKPYPSKEIGTPAAQQPRPVLAAPMSTASVPVLRVAATGLVPVASPITGEPSASLTKSNAPAPRAAQKKHNAHRASRTRKQRRPFVSDREVIVRHFPAASGQ